MAISLERPARLALVLISVLFLAFSLLSGCAGVGVSSKSANSPTPAGSVSVSLSPSIISLQTGATQSFMATVQNDSQNKGVTWTLSGAGCSGAACGGLSANSSASGAAIVYTAPATVPAPATVTVTATSVADGTKSAAATITIAAATKAIIVTVSPMSISVATGGSQNFTATVQNDAQNKGVTWTLLGASCSESVCGTLSAPSSASGAAVAYAAPAVLPSPATITLKATSVADGSKSATATITVTATTPAIVVSVSPSPVTVETVGSQSFTATVQNDSQNNGVNWVLSGTGCSGVTCGTLSAKTSASGATITYTAPTALPSPATVTLTATSVTDGTKSATATITVTSIIAVTVSPGASSVEVGHTQIFAATVSNDGQNKGVAWSLSGAGCSGASCGTLSANVSASGASITYTAPANVPSPALVTLTATSVSDVTKSAAAAITVTAAPGAIVVTVSPTSASVPTLASQNFTATVQNDAQNKGVTWILLGASCGESTCGSLSATSSASGAAITYTAPINVPEPAAVTLRVTSVTDITKSVAVTITITGAAAGNGEDSQGPKLRGLRVSQASENRSAVNSAVEFAAPVVAQSEVSVGARGDDDIHGGGRFIGEFDVFGLLPDQAGEVKHAEAARRSVLLVRGYREYREYRHQFNQWIHVEL
jgi:hypothetical protein